jgi:V8-like Glu-specific endopeptidase
VANGDDRRVGCNYAAVKMNWDCAPYSYAGRNYENDMFSLCKYSNSALVSLGPTIELTGYPSDKPAGTQWTSSPSSDVQVTQTEFFTKLIAEDRQQRGPFRQRNTDCVVGVFATLITAGHPNPRYREYNGGPRVTDAMLSTLTSWNAFDVD